VARDNPTPLQHVGYLLLAEKFGNIDGAEQFLNIGRHSRMYLYCNEIVDILVEYLRF